MDERATLILASLVLVFTTIILTAVLICTPPAHAAEPEQYVQIVSYSGRHVMFVAKPYETHVMTYNCTVEMFTKAESSSYTIICDGKKLKSGNFTGFMYSTDIILPHRKRVKVTVVLNGQEFWFDLLLTRRTPEPEELEMIEMIELTPQELLAREWRAWGGALTGGFIATLVGLLIARRIKAGKVEEL